jgi:hypothetical protein
LLTAAPVAPLVRYAGCALAAPAPASVAMSTAKIRLSILVSL